MHSLNGRYLYQDSGALGSIPGVAASQITPPGFSSIVPQRTQGVNLQFMSVLSPRWINEVRVSAQRIGDDRARSEFAVNSVDRSRRTWLAWFQCWSKPHGDRTGRKPAAEPGETLSRSRTMFPTPPVITPGNSASIFAATNCINSSNQPPAVCSNMRRSISS